MLTRICAILFILIGTTLGWVVLANSILIRTSETDSKLRPDIASTWGAPQEQRQPVALLDRATPTQSSASHASSPLAAESSKVNVNLAFEYRSKGLLWYSIYTVDFSGTYSFRNPDAEARWITLQLRFPAQKAIYDGLTMEVDGRPQPFTSDKEGAYVNTLLGPGQWITLHTAYRSQGLDTWRYSFGDDVTQTRNFTLSMSTNFKPIDFPANTLSPSEKRRTDGGWDLNWRYSNLISGYQIGMVMPQKLQPGPLVGQICQFAPVSLLLFFFVLFVITTVRGIQLHPMNYFFLAAAFFAFHLLLAYLVDHLALPWSFAFASLVSVSLVVSYLRIVVGPRFAAVEAGGAQFLYLILFSYTFFLKEFTGLSITLGCILTLFLSMQATARTRWSEKFASIPALAPRL